MENFPSRPFIESGLLLTARDFMSLISLTLLVLVSIPQPALADPPDSTTAPSAQERTLTTHQEIGLWVGGSVASSHLLAKMPDASLHLIGLRYTWPLSQGPNFALSYTADFASFGALSYPDLPPPSPKSLRDPDTEFHRSDPPVLGAGMTPLGVQLSLRRHPTWQPFASTSAGFLYFPQPIPDSRGKPFNFTVDLGVGLRVAVSPDAVLTVGYRFHHLSNGFRGQINPGFDTNIFYIGVSIPR